MSRKSDVFKAGMAIVSVSWALSCVFTPSLAFGQSLIKNLDQAAAKAAQQAHDHEVAAQRERAKAALARGASHTLKAGEQLVNAGANALEGIRQIDKTAAFRKDQAIHALRNGQTNPADLKTLKAGAAKLAQKQGPTAVAPFDMELWSAANSQRIAKKQLAEQNAKRKNSNLTDFHVKVDEVTKHDDTIDEETALTRVAGTREQNAEPKVKWDTRAKEARNAAMGSRLDAKQEVTAIDEDVALAQTIVARESEKSSANSGGKSLEKGLALAKAAAAKKSPSAIGAPASIDRSAAVANTVDTTETAQTTETAAVADAPTEGWVTMTQDQAKKLIHRYKILKDETSVNLYGYMPKGSEKDIRIRIVNENGKNVVYLEYNAEKISDLEKFAEKCSKSKNLRNDCTYLREADVWQPFSVSLENDVAGGIVSGAFYQGLIDTNLAASDPESHTSDQKIDILGEYKTKETLAAEAAQSAADERARAEADAAIKRATWKQRYDACVRSKDPGDLQIAKDLLAEVDLINANLGRRFSKADELEKIEAKLAKANAEKKLKEFEADIAAARKSKDADQLSILADEIHDWAIEDENEDYQAKAATLMVKIAADVSKLSQKALGKIAALDLADAIYAKIEDFGNLSDQNLAILASYRNRVASAHAEVEMQQMSRLALAAVGGNPMATMMLNAQLENLSHVAQHACNQDTFSAGFSLDFANGFQGDAFSPTQFDANKCMLAQSMLAQSSQVIMQAQTRLQYGSQYNMMSGIQGGNSGMLFQNGSANMMSGQYVMPPMGNSFMNGNSGGNSLMPFNTMLNLNRST